MFTSKPTTITQGDETLSGVLDGFQVEDDGITYIVFVPKSPDSESDAERVVKRVEQVYDDAQVSAREFLRDNAVPDSGEGDR